MPVVGSILAVDFGNVNTRAILIDLVEGAYTEVASAHEPTTAGFPYYDIGIGLNRVARQIGQLTGRQMVGTDGKLIQPEQPDRSGVDMFVATASIGRPLRTVVVGLMPEISVASALRAASGTYVNILDTITLEDARTPQQTLNEIVLARPDLIFLTGGTDDGAKQAVLDLSRIVRLAAGVMRGHEPLILFAGNAALHDDISRLFEGVADVFFTENVRPTIGVERLDAAQLELALAFNTLAGQRGIGFNTVGQMTRLGVLPNAQSYHTIAEYFGKQAASKQGVLIADIGASSSTLSAYADGRVSTSIRTDIGLGTSASSLLEVVGVKAVQAWLPFVSYDDEIRDYVLNKTLRPGLAPDTLRGMYLEHGLLRAGLRALLAAARPAWTPDTAHDDPREPLPPMERIIGAGAGLVNTGRPGLTAMLMLDALEPRGVTRLQVDSSGLIPALGALARLNPAAAVQLADGIENLGTAISLNGKPRAGRKAAAVKIKLANGTTERRSVEGGSLFIYKLDPGVTAEVSVSAGRGLNIGGKKKVKLTVEGGAAGIIIDARGRPLALGDSAQELAAQLPAWYAQVTGDPIREVAMGWLEDMMAENIAGVQPVEAAQDSKKRRGKRGKAAPVPEAIEMPSLSDLELPPAPKSSRAVRSLNKESQPQPQGSDDELRNLLS